MHNSLTRIIFSNSDRELKHRPPPPQKKKKKNHRADQPKSSVYTLLKKIVGSDVFDFILKITFFHNKMQITFCP